MFQVTSYTILYNDNKVETIKVCFNNKVEIDLDKEKFQFWLLVNNRLKWIISKSERDIYRIEQVEGTMSNKEYWAQDMAYIYQDLSDYIKANKYLIKTKNYQS